ncbi:MAG: ISAs1 family transposase, partial [Thauera sp.]|nr:ISAs1 family transposase [Thauera sp.]
NIIRADKTDTRKSSLRLERKGAAWDDGVRERMLGIRSIC